MTSHRRPSLRSAAGFTLLELLVATGMMTILIVSLFATLRVAYMARDTALGAVGPVRAAGEAAIDLIRRDLESALPPTGRLASTFIGSQGAEQADTSSLMFSAIGTPAPGYAQSVAGAGGGSGPTVNTGSSGFMNNSDPTLGGGIIRVAYVVKTSNSGTRTLVREVQRNLLAQVESGVADDESVVCRGVETFTLRYYDGSQWLDTWDSSQVGNVLPMAIEISLVIQRPPSPGAAVNPTAADLKPYVATRVVFPACYDSVAAQAAGGAP